MKKIICFSLLLISMLARGQEYIPLVDNTRVWSVVSLDGHGGAAYTDQYFFGDTVTFNDTIYHELIRKYATESIVGFLREDSTKKVFFRNIYTGKEILLYDFSLEIGDTVQTSSGVMLWARCEVIDIDSIELLNGEHRKRWILASLNHPGLHITWLEGIGNITLYLLNSGYEPFYADLLQILLCSHEDEELVYINDFYNSCNVFRVFVEDINNSPITVFPNPVYDHFSLTGVDTHTMEVKIFNIQGQLVLHQNIGNHEEVNISHLQAGLLIVKVINESGKLTIFKMIKL